MAEIVYFSSGPWLLNRKVDRIPEGTVNIGRPSKWGNPFVVGRDGSREQVVAKYEAHLVSSGLIREVGELTGKNLACWCAPLLCHGHVLLRYANPELRAA